MQKLNYELSLTINDHKFAIEHGVDDLYELLLTISDDKLSEESRNDYVLYWACRNGIVELAEFMIETGTNLNSDNNLQMKVAIEKGKVEIVKLLIKHGATVSIDVLELASKNAQTEILEILENTLKTKK